MFSSFESVFGPSRTFGPSRSPQSQKACAGHDSTVVAWESHCCAQPTSSNATTHSLWPTRDNMALAADPAQLVGHHLLWSPTSAPCACSCSQMALPGSGMPAWRLPACRLAAAEDHARGALRADNALSTCTGTRRACRPPQAYRMLPRVTPSARSGRRWDESRRRCELVGTRGGRAGLGIWGL